MPTPGASRRSAADPHNVVNRLLVLQPLQQRSAPIARRSDDRDPKGGALGSGRCRIAKIFVYQTS
ncbi:hypothetical protein [Rathayibacter toxicus]|uniref:hypothetical protein n=1 Tax=Rathayibacter toxicus TaxID=145458 RepID=UPI000CE7D271|nr:hypothetical protein [Rathayibacter toxicus]PPI56694.1 hypothetical protein C5D35_00095 [Rathayibacter toxicus]QOD10547.1 hypothetical protein BSG36_00605 [Rathayibacter toxicus]QWL27281.1 hypothetical protein E2R33_00595 [Rathayibacter toxicus]QWL29410.1 hypothetical protein E2R34_00570 [Rathayibacter toxicus]QWL31498.1 hypothetical protein E2R35_00575 [Rathayibacter toxicus]